MLSSQDLDHLRGFLLCKFCLCRHVASLLNISIPKILVSFFCNNPYIQSPVSERPSGEIDPDCLLATLSNVQTLSYCCEQTLMIYLFWGILSCCRIIRIGNEDHEKIKLWSSFWSRVRKLDNKHWNCVCVVRVNWRITEK